ncbi:MAG: DNA polymerase III subunit epsilon [Flavobacteriales bacterium]|nr:DNA polymerase III subunit epsilon [Flavobacteriales bacterium]
MYCIVDLETTGGSATKSRVIEIAVYKTDGKKIVDSFSSLVNPGRPIPRHIINLTGITDEMVDNAPSFSEIIDQVEKITEDSVFVAHNVNFDYGFMRAEYERCGRQFIRKKLCTVRLSRQIIKNQPSYSLGKLSANLGIKLIGRHRAAGDAKATVELFHLLLKKDEYDVIPNSLKIRSLEALLPPNLPKNDFLALPEAQGIYYFKDARKKIIYVGQAKNIKQRVHSHFSGNSNSKSKHYFSVSIYSLDYQLVPNPLLLDLIEAIEIKKHWPRYNRSMKRFSLNFGIFKYEDRNGYLRLAIGRSGKHDRPIKSFKTHNQCIDALKEMLAEYALCPRLIGLQPLGSGKCNYIEEVNCKGACCGKEDAADYNKRVKEALRDKIEQKHTFILEEKEVNTKAIVLVEKGRLKGYASLGLDQKVESIEEAKELISATYDDQDLAWIIQKHLPRALKNDAVTYFK